MTYGMSVDELFRDKVRRSKPHLPVQGTLVPGSLTRQENPCRYEFRLAGKGNDAGKPEVLRVRYDQCVVPDSLCDRPGRPREVAVYGRFDASASRFDATSIVAYLGHKFELRQAPCE